MTRAEALRGLLEGIEDGCWPGGELVERLGHSFAFDAYTAYHGSLDAAKALHEAVLPGWTFRLYAFTPHGNSAHHVHVFRMGQTEDDPVTGANSSGYKGDCPARAWLIAILRALLEGAEDAD